MSRIAIIGNAGGGKSILARKLGGKFQVPVYEFDTIQWRPGWVQNHQEDISLTHDNWLEQPNWIIDGWGSWDLLKERFDAADTLIFVDLPLMNHYWWALKRQVTAIFGLTKDWPPEGCSAFKVSIRMIKLIYLIHKKKRPQLITLLNHYQNHKLIIHIKSPEELRNLEIAK